jgi:hypothetical protein
MQLGQTKVVYAGKQLGISIFLFLADSFLPTDCFHWTRITGFLNLVRGRTCRIDHDCLAVVVKQKNIRAKIAASTASYAEVLIHNR